MKKRTKEYRKNFAIVFTAAFVVMSVLAYSLYVNYIEGINRENFEENNEMFLQSCKNMDNSFRATKSIATVLFNNESIISYSNEEYNGYENIDFENMLKISREITLMQSCFLYADFSVAVTKLDEGLMVLDAFTMNTKKGLEMLNIKREDIEEAFAESNTNGIWFKLMVDKSKSRLALVAKNHYVNASDVYIIFSFSTDTLLENRQSSFLMFNNSGAFEKNAEKCSRRQTEYVRRLAEEEALNPEIIKNTVQNSSVSYFIQNSEIFSDCCYAYLYDNEKHTPGYILLLIPIAVFAYVAAKYITSFMYKPLLNILSYFGEEISNDDYLDVLKDNINNLLDERDDYLRRIEEEKQKLKNNFLTELMLGMLSDKQAEEKISETGEEWLVGECMCVLIGFDAVLENDMLPEKTKNKIEEEIVKYIKNKVEGAFACNVIKFDTNTYACISQYSDVLEDYFTLLLDEINEMYEKRVIVTIGRKVGTGLHIYDSYFDAAAVMETQRAKNMFGVFVNTDMQKSNSIYYPLSVEQKLFEHVMRGEEEKVRILLRHIFAKNFDVNFMEYNTKMMFEMAIVLTIKRIIYQLGADENNVFGEGTIIYLEIKMAKTREEFETKVFKLFDGIFAYMRKRNNVYENESESQYGKQIMRYIDENYLGDVALSDISDSLGLSVSLICRVLKDEYNTTFKSQVNKKKIEKAKAIINAKPNIKIKNIYTQIGFNNSTTFTRLFKKYEGVTFEEYRKIAAEEQNV